MPGARKRNGRPGLPTRPARLLAGALYACLSAGARAQPAPGNEAVNIGPPTDLDLAAEADNPVSHNYVLPFRLEILADDNSAGESQYTGKLSNALIPIDLTEDWLLIARSTAPFVWQPPAKSRDPWQTGLDNFQTTWFLSPRHGGPVFAGLGPVLLFPTTSNRAIGIHRWGAGPSAALVYKPSKQWQFALVVNNIWSFGGPSQSGRRNSLLINPIAGYYFGDGWSVSTAPNITANWLARPSEQWTLPLGGGFSKTFHALNDGLKFAAASYYNTIRPKPGRDTWQLQLTLTLVLPR